MTFFSSNAYFYIFWGLFVVSFILKDAPPFKKIWSFYKWMFAILFLVLTAGFVKKEIKDWWKKD